MSSKIRPDDLPSAMDSLDAIIESIGERELAVFLDYDGTLVPIVQRPELAVISAQMRRTVAKLADIAQVAIVSGRDLDDVRQRVGLDGVGYAGSHGFDIVDADGQPMAVDQADQIMAALDQAEDELRGSVEAIDGAIVERKKYSLAIHYRRVDRCDRPAIEAHLRRAVDQQSALEQRAGKKVFDLGPALDWDKGKAVDWLLARMSSATPAPWPLYIGDDVTDEDAFRQLAGRGVTIAVQQDAAPTAAQYRLADPDEVQRFLESLAARLHRR